MFQEKYMHSLFVIIKTVILYLVGSVSPHFGYNFECASLSDGHSDRLCRSLSLHKHCEPQSCAGRIDGHFRTVGLSLKFHPSAFVVHSEGREDKQVHMYKEIIPGLGVRRLRKHRARNSLETFWIQGFKAALDFVTQVSFVAKQKGFFFSCVLSTQQSLKGESCRYRRRVASWLCISHSLDTLGTFTRGQS